MKKRILSALLALCMTLTMLPVEALAVDIEDMRDNQEEDLSKISHVGDAVLGAQNESAASEEPDYPISGTCGTTLTWTLDASGDLTISGSGNMSNYSSNDAPWYPYRAVIKRVYQ